MSAINHRPPIDPIDPLAAVLSAAAQDALRARIEENVKCQLRRELPEAIASAMLTPWLDTKHAAVYLGITENALRLRQRAGLVKTHRDPAGRLRFHRDDLDRSMSPEPDKRPRRRSRSVRYPGHPI
jgi:hypothetical protein